MAVAPKLYTRLSRAPLGLGSYKSLWLAADHFMQVDSNGYTENYQRFQFSDIQGFFITNSSRRLYWNIVWASVAVVAALPFTYALLNGEMPEVSTVFLVISAIFLVWNNLLGPSCRVYLVTRVQTLHLGALARRRKADKVLGRLQPLIESAQSSLKVPEAAGVKVWATGIPAVPTPDAPEATPVNTPATGAEPEAAPPAA
jgi:hypothetical protein